MYLLHATKNVALLNILRVNEVATPHAEIPIQRNTRRVRQKVFIARNFPSDIVPFYKNTFVLYLQDYNEQRSGRGSGDG